jgi:hypothetical protein
MEASFGPGKKPPIGVLLSAMILDYSNADWVRLKNENGNPDRKSVAHGISHYHRNPDTTRSVKRNFDYWLNTWRESPRSIVHNEEIRLMRLGREKATLWGPEFVEA